MTTATADLEAPPPPRTSLDVLREMDAPAKNNGAVRGARKGADDPAWADRARDEVDQLRASALATRSIFTYCFVAPMSLRSLRTLYGLSMVVLAVVVQVAVPLIIVVTRQPILDIDAGVHGSNSCPNQSGPETKFIGLTLSLYFVVQTIALCTNKLRGLGFLFAFVDLGLARSSIVALAVLSQFAGMAAAGGAQFLLFVGNADGPFVVLVLQSLAMTFCLTVDVQLVGHRIGDYASGRLAAVSRGELLCGGLGVGERGGGMPERAFERVRLLATSETFVLAMIATTGIAWAVMVAYCM